jgi:hypothetical protein
MVSLFESMLLKGFLASVLISCSPTQSEKSQNDDLKPEIYESTGEIYHLDASDREVIEARALEGDRQALDAIINHYELGVAEESTDNLIHWLRIAYRAGDEKRLRDLVFFSRHSNLDCTEIVLYFVALQNKDPKGASELSSGRVAECLAI